jgi:putative protease
MQNYLRGHSESGRSLYVGDVIAWDAARGLVEIDVKNRFSVGDRIEVIHPSGNFEVALTRMEKADGVAISVAPGNGHRVWIALNSPLAAELQGAMLARFV